MLYAIASIVKCSTTRATNGGYLVYVGFRARAQRDSTYCAGFPGFTHYSSRLYKPNRSFATTPSAPTSNGDTPKRFRGGRAGS
jgi:hypothetical protein